VKHPRVVIHNHHGRDEKKATSSELNMPWERRQVITDALGHIQRAAKGVPDQVTTGNQVATVQRALLHLREEIDSALECLEEKKK
jgi:archaellum component FlaC